MTMWKYICPTISSAANWVRHSSPSVFVFLSVCVGLCVLQYFRQLSFHPRVCLCASSHKQSPSSEPECYLKIIITVKLLHLAGMRKKVVSWNGFSHSWTRRVDSQLSERSKALEYIGCLLRGWSSITFEWTKVCTRPRRKECRHKRQRSREKRSLLNI